MNQPVQEGCAAVVQNWQQLTNGSIQFDIGWIPIEERLGVGLISTQPNSD